MMRGVHTALWDLLLLMSAYCAAMLVVDGVRVVRGPDFFDYRPAESVQYTAAIRLLEGEPVYPVFSESGVYNVYGFMHTWIFAAAMRVFGDGLFVPKAAVFVWSTLGLAGLAVAARLATGSGLAGLVAVGVFGGLYPVIAPPELYGLRPDAFAASATVWGLCAALAHVRGGFKRARWAMIAAVLFVLAGLAKQTFVLFAVAYFVYLWMNVGIRPAILAAIPAVLTGVAGLLRFNTGGEHLIAATLAFGDHKLHGMGEIVSRLKAFLVPQILPLAVGLLAMARIRAHPEVRLIALTWAAAFVAGLVPSIKVGGATNAMLLYEMITGLMAGMAVRGWMPGTAGETRRAAAVAAALLAFLLLQLAPLTSRSLREPKSAPLDAAREFIQAHRDERIYFPARNYITYQVQGEFYIEEFVLFDYCEPRMGNRALPADLVSKIESGYFDYVIGPLGREETVFARFLFQHYGEPEAPRIEGWEVYVPLARSGTESAAPEETGAN